MRVGDFYRPGGFGLSIEIFPPKTENGEQALQQTLDRLAKFQPAFISCTYGAGGTTRDQTLRWCQEIQDRCGVPATAHFTCVGSTREELLAWLDRASNAGVGNIMALRGDPPQGEKTFQAVDGGLKYANELVELIRAHHPDMGIGVAGYPEKHLECVDAATDLINLKRKVDAGADAVFTQLFYENENFFRFRDEYERIGITVPLVAGIMPITSFARIQRITAMCGAIFPEALSKRLEAVQDDADAQFEIGVGHAIQQCQELIDQGVPGIHLYVLNKSDACERILGELNWQPAEAKFAG